MRTQGRGPRALGPALRGEDAGRSRAHLPFQVCFDCGRLGGWSCRRACQPGLVPKGQVSDRSLSHCPAWHAGRLGAALRKEVWDCSQTHFHRPDCRRPGSRRSGRVSWPELASRRQVRDRSRTHCLTWHAGWLGPDCARKARDCSQTRFLHSGCGPARGPVLQASGPAGDGTEGAGDGPLADSLPRSARGPGGRRCGEGEGWPGADSLLSPEFKLAGPARPRATDRS